MKFRNINYFSNCNNTVAVAVNPTLISSFVTILMTKELAAVFLEKLMATQSPSFMEPEGS
jgi:hypothetical protein